MARMFESKFDRFLYGDKQSDLFKAFNDKAQLIEDNYKAYFERHSIFELIRFQIEDLSKPAIEIDDDGIPDFIVQEIGAAFTSTFGR
ncbi:hypothetical protein [Mucilaginibacter paludis]|uniref:Uncharacterized protein n=1 Tax=Mucilaginibacter paludis DSM 18603 TaxID=714943 RepID=H1Y5Q6_9SPHI|nr:hypothetical protein [Mucilaginibacter paludis]EHQ29832.1 hypothetical protein Mucpa_5764 [Mucilaginibacter paludis DSM 18603]